MADELRVVTLDELKNHSQELVREVHEMGEAVFIMDGDNMVARLLPPEMSLEEIRESIKAFREIEHWPEDNKLPVGKILTQLILSTSNGEGDDHR